METREIIITSTSFQGTKRIQSAATTLRELKTDMTNAGINYDGMEFKEGISNTTLLDDDSVLPKELPYKGGITNTLVFYLTKPSKKINSGIDRKEFGAWIKKTNLSDKFKKIYGKNYTNCSNNVINEFYANNNTKKSPSVKTEKVTKVKTISKKVSKGNSEVVKRLEDVKKEATDTTKQESSCCNDVVTNMLNLLVNKGIISKTEYNTILNTKVPVLASNSNISDNEALSMFK